MAYEKRTPSTKRRSFTILVFTIITLTLLTITTITSLAGLSSATSANIQEEQSRITINKENIFFGEPVIFQIDGSADLSIRSIDHNRIFSYRQATGRASFIPPVPGHYIVFASFEDGTVDSLSFFVNNSQFINITFPDDKSYFMIGSLPILRTGSPLSITTALRSDDDSLYISDLGLSPFSSNDDNLLRYSGNDNPVRFTPPKEGFYRILLLRSGSLLNNLLFDNDFTDGTLSKLLLATNDDSFNKLGMLFAKLCSKESINNLNNGGGLNDVNSASTDQEPTTLSSIIPSLKLTTYQNNTTNTYDKIIKISIRSNNDESTIFYGRIREFCTLFNKSLTDSRLNFYIGEENKYEPQDQNNNDTNCSDINNCYATNNTGYDINNTNNINNINNTDNTDNASLIDENNNSTTSIQPGTSRNTGKTSAKESSEQNNQTPDNNSETTNSNLTETELSKSPTKLEELRLSALSSLDDRTSTNKELLSSNTFTTEGNLSTIINNGWSPVITRDFLTDHAEVLPYSFKKINETINNDSSIVDNEIISSGLLSIRGIDDSSIRVFAKEHRTKSFLNRLRRALLKAGVVIGLEDEISVKPGDNLRALSLEVALPPNNKTPFSKQENLLISFNNVSLKNLSTNNPIKLSVITPDEITRTNMKTKDQPSLNNELLSIKKIVAIDPSSLSFTTGSLITEASGSLLYKCANWSFEESKCEGSWIFYGSVSPGNLYSIPLSPQDPAFAEVGVSTINSNKSIYSPGENAKIYIVTLDPEGFLTDKVTINLSVKSPDGRTTFFSNNELNRISKGVRSLTINNLSLGNYSLSVAVNSTDPNSPFFNVMSTSFAVMNFYPFDIIRSMPFSVDPWAGPVNLSITLRSRVGPVLISSFTEFFPSDLSPVSLGGGIFINGSTTNQTTNTNQTTTANKTELLDDISSTEFAEFEKYNSKSAIVWENFLLTPDNDFKKVFNYSLSFPLVSPDLKLFGTALVNYSLINITTTDSISKNNLEENKTRNNSIIVSNNTIANNTVDHIILDNKATDDNMLDEKINYSIKSPFFTFQEFRPWFLAIDPTFDTSNARDIDITTMSDDIIVIAWYDDSDADVSFEVWNTSGTRLVNEVDVDTSGDSGTRVAVSAISNTQFVISWIDSPVNDLYYAIYDTNGNQVLAPTQIDSNVGSRTDVGNTELGSNFVICDANDADNDADYRIYNNAGSQTVGESNVDGNIGPAANGQNLVDCDATSSNRWVYAWFDDQSNDVTVRLMDNNGNAITGATDADTNAGETAQVAVAGLPNNRAAVLWYDSGQSDVYLRIYDVSSDTFSTVSTITLDSNAGSTCRVSIDALDWKGTPYLVASWMDSNSGDIKAAVYDLDGNQITAPFTLVTDETTSYPIIDVEGTNPLLNTGLCTGVFVLGYTTSSSTAVFKGFWYNGTSWDGICPNFPPDHTNPLLVSENGYNETTEDLICYNQSTSDYEGDPVRNIYDWVLNGSSIIVLNTPFDIGNSTWTQDHSINRNNGVVTGATKTDSGCVMGSCYSFDGNNDYIRFQGDDLSTTGEPFTVSFWFNPSTTIDSSIANNIALIEKREGSGGNDWLINFQTTDSGRMRIRSYHGNIQTQTNTWNANTWYHIVFVYNGNNDARVYVNGALNNYNNDYAIGTLTQSTEDIFVGTRYDQSQDFNGKIDELIIFNRSLSPEEVSKLYNLDYDELSFNETAVNDQWQCAVTPIDPYSAGARLLSNSLTVLVSSGDPPTISSVSDNPDPVVLGSDLNITATVTDPDGNLDKVWVLINGTNHSMTNIGGNNYRATIDTTGFATETQTYTVFANDTVGKISNSSSTVTVTNQLSVDATTDKSSYYKGETINMTTEVSIGSEKVNNAAVSDYIIKINSSAEKIKKPWWNTNWHYRKRINITDQSGKVRENYWISKSLIIDPNCQQKAYNSSLRIINDENEEIDFLMWNITYCDNNHIKSLWVSFRINLTANQEKDYYVYYDNTTKTTKGSRQKPWHIIYVGSGGSGNAPDINDLQLRYDAALNSLGINSSDFYTTTSTSAGSNDVTASMLTPYPYVHYASGAKYQRSWSSTEATNFFNYVNQNGNFFLTGQDLGYDADRDSWIYNSVFKNLTHMTAGWDDDAGDPSTMTISTNHPVTQYLGSSGSTISLSSDWFDGYTASISTLILEWTSSTTPRAGTVNDGLINNICSSNSCGKTIYFGGMLRDTSGNGISSSTDRTNFIKGVINWFLNNNSATIRISDEQKLMANDNGVTNSNGLLTKSFTSTNYPVGWYAAASNASKSPYNPGFDYSIFEITIDYSVYPNITAISDTPDPVPKGENLTITATVTDSDNNLDKVWVLINGTNHTMSNTGGDDYEAILNTSSFSTGTFTYTVFANDTDGHMTNRSGTYTVTNSFSITTGVDKSEYIIGETITSTTQSFLGFSPTTADITLDIIRGNTDTIWWNTNWKKRMLITVHNGDSYNHTNEIVRTNLTINATSCNELRLIKGRADETLIETPYAVEDSGTTTTGLIWCYIRFITNVSTNSNTYYYAYYNNTAATAPSYSVRDSYITNDDFESTTGWTYYETEADDTGEYSTTTYNSPSTSYHIYSGDAGTVGNYGEIYQDISMPCVGCSLSLYAYNRLESGGSTADAFRAQIIIGSDTISDIGTPSSSNSPINWTKRGGSFTSSSSTERLHLRLYTDVTFTGGNYAQRDVYWDDALLLLNNPSTTTQGNEEELIEEKTGTTDTSGFLTLTFDSTNYTNTTYSAVALGQKSGYNNDTDYITFLMKLNTSTYPQINSVTDNPDPVLYYQNITFTANVTDVNDNIDKVWLVIDNDGTKRFMTLNTTSGLYTTTINASLNEGTHHYYVYANDTDAQLTTSDQYSFTILKNISVTVTGDKVYYAIGDTATFTASATLVGALPDANTKNYIIYNITSPSDKPWWNTSWRKRKRISITIPSSNTATTPITDAIIGVNITGVNSCDDIRIVDQGSSYEGNELPTRVIIDKSSSNWCYVRFYANITSDSTSQFYAYFDNPTATAQTNSRTFYKTIYFDNGENSTLRSEWVRDPDGTDAASSGWWAWSDPQNYQINSVDAQPENDVDSTGTYALFTGPTGDNTGTEYEGDVDGGVTTIKSRTIDLTGWKKVNITFYRWFYSNDNSGDNDDTCALIASVDNGTNYDKNIMVLHDDDLGSDTDAYNQWDQVSYSLEDILSASEFNNEFVLLAKGDDYGTADVVECGFDVFNITAFESNINAIANNTEVFVQNSTDITDINGEVTYTFDTTTASEGNYAAITLASKNPYNDGYGAYYFSVASDAPPNVELTSPANGTLTNNNTIYLTCNASDNLKVANITLYDNIGGTWQAVSTQTINAQTGTATFTRTTGSTEGTFEWNCLAYDNNSQSSFAPKNYTIILDKTPPLIRRFYPINETIWQNSNNNVLFSFETDDTNGVINCALIMDGSAVKSITNPELLRPNYMIYSGSDGLSFGTHYYAINCTDSAGNTNQTTNTYFTLLNKNYTMPTTFYEKSWFNSTHNTNFRLEANRNNSEHNFFRTTIPGETITITELASLFASNNGLYINGSRDINISGEFLSNPVGEGAVSWYLYKMSSSLTKTLICSSENNPVFSTTTASCQPTNNNDVYVSKDDTIFLILNFTNDYTSNVSITHYWDSARDSFIQLPSRTVGFVSINITAPTTDDIDKAQGSSFILNCTANCEEGDCINTNIYVEYDDGSGTGYQLISNTGGLYINSSLNNNPEPLGTVANNTNKTATFTVFTNTTNSYGVRCRATTIAETKYSRELTVNVGDNQPPIVILDTPVNNTFVKDDPVGFMFVVNDSSDIDNCSLLINGAVNATSTTITVNSKNTIYSSLPTGTYNWTIQCYDDGGLLGTANQTWIINVDTNKPTLTINYPINTTVDNSYVIFNITTSDDWNANLTCDLTVDGTLYDTISANNYQYTSQNTLFTEGPFSVGVHNYNITCYDKANNTNTSKTLYFNITDSAPDVDLISPVNNTLLNSTTIVLVYQVLENNALQYCDLYLDGAFYARNNTPIDIGHYNNFTITPTDGTHNWTVLCNDSGGQSDKPTPWWFTKDSTPPTVTLISPADNSLFNNDTVSLSFNATDEISNNLTCNIYINDQLNETINLTSGETYTTTKTGLSDNNYHWNVTCTDEAENTGASSTWLFTINRTPTITLISPANNSFTKDAVNFTYLPEDNDELTCYLYIDGTQYASETEVVEGTNNIFTITGLSDGNHDWFINCSDNGAFTNTAKSSIWYFTVDTILPTISLLTPENDTTINGSSANISYTPTDNNGGSLTCDLYLDGAVNDTATITSGTTYNLTITKLPNGYHYWNVTCTDQAGNQNTSETWQWFNNVPPSVYLQSPINMTFNNTGYWNLTYKPVINDPYAETAYFVNCSLYLDDVLNQTDTSIVRDNNNSFIITGVAEGTHNWSVRCYENSGARGDSDKWYFVEDDTPPHSIITTANNSWFNTPTPIISFNISDNLIYDINYQFFVDSTPDANAYGTATPNTSMSDSLSTQTEGNHQLILYVSDQAGNDYNSTPINITIDLTAPTITLNSPENNATLTNDSVLFNFSINDNLASTLNCDLYIDGTVNKSYNSITVPDTITELVTNFTFGTHTWYVTCTDQAGNQNTSETRNFTIPAPDFVITSGNITFNNTSPAENSTVMVSATVFNIGDSSAENVIVQFWMGDPDNGGTQIGTDHVISLFGVGQNYTFNETFNALLGTNDIFVVIDPPYSTGGNITEDNETNNKAYNTVRVGFYNIFSGLANSLLQVANNKALPVWQWNLTNSTGSKLYVTDSDASPEFTQLYALGRDSSGTAHFSDFATLDSALGSTAFDDNINKTWTTNNAPRGVANLEIYNREVDNIPIVNSTNTSSFITGILWDGADGGAYYDGSQDVVFVTVINQSKQGSRGVYDYEIKIPATLDSLVGSSDTVTFYAEIE